MEADGHSFIYFGKSQFFTFHWTEGLVGGSRGQKVVEEVQGELFFLGKKKKIWDFGTCFNYYLLLLLAWEIWRKCD